LGDSYLNCSDVKKREEGREKELIMWWASKGMGGEFERSM
jgi:hypothetical protein